MSGGPEAAASYRDALRRAERALALGRPNAALLAYAEAAAASPDRSGPYVAMGALHLGADRIAAAIDAFDGALRRTPRDPDALRGRAEALVRAGRPVDAAAALDELVAVNEESGEVVEAMAAARRALELAESRPRRRTLASLAGRARGMAPAALSSDAPAGGELAAAERLLEIGDRGAPEVLPAGMREAIAALERADVSALRGDTATAREGYLDAATRLAATGSHDAALEACFAAILVRPDDVRLHLTMAEIYARSGWTAQLAEKTRVLERFLELEPDAATSARLVALSSEPGT